MAQTARIRLASTDYSKLEEVCKRIQDVALKSGAKHSGTIPLPTKKLLIPTRKGPCGGGTESYEKWQMRVHKRMIDINTQGDDGTLRKIMRVEIPENVHMKIEIKDK